MTLEDLSRIVDSCSSMSKADFYGVIIALSEAIGESLTNGNIIKTEPLGTFQLNISGTATETEEELGKTAIKSAKISYKPSKQLKSRLKKITYKRIR